MKLNFDNVEIYNDLSKTTSRTESIRKDFANFIYNRGQGLPAHAIAIKIYNGDAETEYTPEEVQLIRVFSQECSPAVIDAITELIAKSGGIPMQE